MQKEREENPLSEHKLITNSKQERRRLHINVQWFRGGLVLKAHRFCVSLNSRLESNKEEEKEGRGRLSDHASCVQARARI